MQPRQKLLAVLCLAVLAMVLAGCEDTDPLAGETSTIQVSANPGTIVIDSGAAQTSGSSTIIAQLFDKNGVPLDGVAVLFSTTGGTLDSATNSCGSGGLCSISGGACTSSADCPATAPRIVTTNPNGIAVDRLSLRLADPASVTVTASSGAATPGTVVVTKTVDTGDLEPDAVIVLVPASKAFLGQNVLFDGSDSVDTDGSITCYRWTVTGVKHNSSASGSAANFGVQGNGANEESFSEFFLVGQTLTVTLEVSDIPNFPCPRDAPLDDSGMRGSATATYDICNNANAPIVLDPPDPPPITLSGGSASVVLNDAGSNDPDAASGSSGIAEIRWACGGSQGDQLGQSATCVYTTPGVKIVTLTVTDAATPLVCRRSSQATIAVTVN